MADLTVFFPSSGAAPHDCAYSAVWGGTSQAVRGPAPSTRGTTDIAIPRYCNRGAGQTRGLGGQWVSDAQSARSWTTADTFDIAIYCRDVYESLTSKLYLDIRIFNAAGDTAIGTLYTGIVNSVNWTGQATCRHADGVAIQNNVDCPENGHIVVEIGLSNVAAGEIVDRIFCGENVVTPAPLNDTDEDEDTHHPYIAFTYGAGGPSPIGPAGAIVSAEDVDGAAMMRGTIQSEV